MIFVLSITILTLAAVELYRRKYGNVSRRTKLFITVAVFLFCGLYLYLVGNQHEDELIKECEKLKLQDQALSSVQRRVRESALHALHLSSPAHGIAVERRGG